VKRRILLLATIAFLATAAPAQAITQSVSINDNFFEPATKAVNRGDKVTWTNLGTAFDGHTTTGDTPLAFWGSPRLAHNASYTTPVALTAAGTYPYHCTVHFSMKGKVQVPLTLAKSVRKITLTLSSAPADATHKFVVQRKVGSAFQTIATVTTATYVFNATAAGTYTFRSALQKNGTTATAAFFSLPKSITVS
jgi:plastocyanin